ncbi:uncharacterized protein LOC110853130 [Folsomia candida]|uniref:uncharacterized protein LOC110853130 n=1 Tax=Folsomia candida TaxID=158441 RepID=UPI000B8F6314|nr:uncharacterized protein LOC110853130 [Folsomia candida]
MLYLNNLVFQKSEQVKNLTTWVKTRTSEWENNFSIPLPHPPRQFSQRSPQIDSTVKKVEAKLADGDIRGAIRLACSDDTIAPNDDDTLSVLREKHPVHPEPTNYPQPLADDSVIEAVHVPEVAKAVSTFPPGSAGGLDGLRPQILKDLLSCNQGETGEHLAQAITDFFNHVIAGKVPAKLCPILYGASLTALRKKTGGIRPIAVGNTWRRLAAKVILAKITPQLIDHFSPHQLGVGIKGGAETGAHAARVYYNYPHHTPKAFLKIDFRNAFNEVRRDTLLHTVRDNFPSIFPFVSQCYANPSSLFFGTTSLPSLLGCHQGDPLGPSLFSLVIHPIIKTLDTELNAWYLDDGTIADTPETVLAALEKVSRMGEEVGLYLNHNKYEVGVLGADDDTITQIFQEFQNFAPGIQLITRENATLLGSPLTNEAMEAVLAAKTEQLATFSKRLKKISAHSAFFLLRASISIPRLIYFLRCSPSWRKMEALALYDATLKDALEGILNCSLSEAAWMQSSLPVKEGGLGVRHAEDVAIPCFLSSVYSTQPLMEQILPVYLHGSDAAIAEGEERWTSLGPTNLPPNTVRGLQTAWERPIIDITVSHLVVAAATSEDTARLCALRDKYAGIWLNALPSPQIGTLLSNEAFRIAISLRLGCDVCQPHTCPCGAQVSSRGYHGLSCRRSAGRWSRHAAANDVIARALRSADVPCILEPPGCSHQDGKHPDGMTLVPWARGRSLVWDFTCADTFAPSYLPETVRHQGAAATKAEDRKKKLYAFLLDRLIFMPVAIETTGTWGQEGLSFIKEIGQRIATATGEPRSTTFLLQRLGITVQRGNVASILGTLPPGKKFNEVYYI